MVESHFIIRQLLAESKFVEAQKAVEVQFLQKKNSENAELLELYFETLISQNKEIPLEMLLSLIEKLLLNDTDKAVHWLNLIPKNKFKENQRLLKIEIILSEKKGKTEELFHLISRFHILQYESRIPAIPELINSIAEKYFPKDFQIQLQRTALLLMTGDLKSSEKSIIELIMSCFERSSPRGTKEKLLKLYEVLNSTEEIYYLELYKNFCLLMTSKELDKKNIKKIVELVIYVEDFRMQCLILNLIVRQGWDEIAQDYAFEIRQNAKYSYVYFDKFLPHLKNLFFQKKESKSVFIKESISDYDMEVEKYTYEPIDEEMLSDLSADEMLLAKVLKFRNFSTKELLDIAVSFLQSDYYYAALKASQLAYDSTSDDEEKLKSNYLKVTCLLKRGDYRAALDIALDAMAYAKTQNDILSFLYSQAEAYLRLKEYKAAKTVLNKILKIDDNYRLAKERLDRLNAI